MCVIIDRIKASNYLNPNKLILKDEHQTFYKEIITALRQDSLSVFVGAGLSVPAGYVDWKNLLSDLAKELGIDIDTANDLVEVAQQHVEYVGGRGVINQHIVNALAKPAVLTKNHRLLSYFPIETYWTTNFDNLIEQALTDIGKLPHVKYQVSHLSLELPEKNTIVYKMHGDQLTPNDTVIIKDDFYNYVEKRGAFLDILCAELLQKKFIFLGISFSDPNLQLVFEKLSLQLGNALKPHWYFNKRILRNDPDIKSDDEFESAIEKQAAFVERLKAFQLRPVWIDNYAEITDIVGEIYITAALEEYKDLQSKIQQGIANNSVLLTLADKYPAAIPLLEQIHIYLEFLAKDHNLAFSILGKHLKVEPENVLKLTQKGACLHNYYYNYDEAEKYFLKALLIDKTFVLAHTNLATNYKRLKNFDAARYHYETALRIEPNNEYAHAGIGSLLMNLNDYSKAKMHLEKAVEINLKDASSFHNLGILHMRYLHDKELSKKYFEQSLHINNENEETHLAYGLLLMEDFKDNVQSRIHFEKALKLNQKNYRAHWLIAHQLNLSNTDPLGAQIRLNDAIELNPENSDLYRTLGESYLNDKKENWQLAIKSFETAIELNPADLTAQFNLGYLASVYLKDDQRAKSYFLRALELSKIEPNIYLNLANVYLKLGEIENAEAIYKQMLDAIGPNAVAYYYLGTNYYNKQMFSEAIELLSKGLKIVEMGGGKPDDVELGARICYNLSLVYWNGLDDFEKAKLFLEQSIHYDDRPGNSYFQLGAILNNKFDDYLSARKYAEQAVLRMPNNMEAHFNLGVILSNLEENILALEALHKALGLDSNSFKVNYNLADVYDALEKFEDAVKYYRKALEIDKDNIDCTFQLAKVLASKLHNLKEGALLYDQVLELSGNAEKFYPQAAVTHYSLAKSLAHEDRQNTVTHMLRAKQLATLWWEKHLEMQRSIKFGFYHIATIEAQQGRFDNALFYLDYARREDTLDEEYVIKGSSDMVAVIAQCIYKDGKYNNYLLKSKELFIEAIELNPKADYHYADLGLIEIELGNFNGAIEAYKKSVEINPDQAKTYYNMGAIYQNSLKDYVNAWICYENSIQLNPRIAEAYNNMGILREMEGGYSEAKMFYQKALEINPTLSQAKNNLGNLGKKGFI